MATQSTPPSSSIMPSFDPGKIIAALGDFYTFLAKLPWIEPADVLSPPPGGWPNITRENFACLGKNDEVIELLRHLPYIRMDGKGLYERDYALAYSTFPCDYRRSYFQKPNFTEDAQPWEVPETDGGRFSFPPWVVPLTYGKNHGDYLMLDTTDGKTSLVTGLFEVMRNALLGPG